MSFSNVILYFIGLTVFGFLYWLLGGITDAFIALNIHNTTDFTSYELLLYIWSGIVIVYLIFGGIWLIRSFQKGSALTGGV